jgi:hypothetical protein
LKAAAGDCPPPAFECSGIRSHQAWAEYPVYAAHRIVEDSTMDTRRFRHPSPSDAFAAFRWLGWVMLMMFVLVQTAQAAGHYVRL